VGTDKRERQKANRQARLAELQRQQRRSTSRKKVIRIGLIVVVALGAAFGLSRLIGQDDDTVDAADSTVPTSDAAATTTAAPPSTLFPGSTITGETPCPAADGSSERANSFENPPPMCIDPAKTYTAVVDTSEGSFTVALDAAAAPQTVNNFVVLSRYHFYDGLPFHRIEPGFVVQGGDPTGTGFGDPGYSIPDELPPSLEYYTAGTMAMANSGSPNTGGSQFFINLTDTGLPGPNYSLFGNVTEGFDTTVKALEATKAEGRTPTITSITITES
jgi:cyclophilin family peptidyl-prolyl cis-trans isomerase